ncbi:TPA: hypothetical protein N0F65_006916 [Lagenidium giganteum]|uniref:Uncharacterized protein n=1 Tax=Lagenidium giganteum TaxID=4803 RepID=A0AAV2ZH57_9STRA|nr:TPA: hypothetical protein N0F65_006916 [Lagenidium giganteum]
MGMGSLVCENKDALVRCTFDQRGCRHASMFADEYKRTNRTKGTKILRCFPHCCPEHVDRSYCGSGVYVQVDVSCGVDRLPQDDDICDSGRQLMPQEMMVFAHFEETGANPYALFDELPEQQVLKSIQTEQHPKGEWIEGLVDSTISQDVFLYNINPGARWYYEWGSAATKAQRFTKHMLRVYVFQVVPQKHVLRVIGMLSSKEFMVVSYRRAPNELRADRRILELLVDKPTTSQLVTEPSALDDPTIKRISSGDYHSDESSTTTYGDAGMRRKRPRSFDQALPTSMQRAQTQKKLWEIANPDAVMSSKHFAVIYHFLCHANAFDFKHCLQHWSYHASANKGSSRSARSTGMDSGDGTGYSWDFIRDLERIAPSSPAVTSDQKTLALVDVCTQLTSWLLFEESNIELYQRLLVGSSKILLDRMALRSAFIKTVGVVHRLADTFLRGHNQSTLASLSQELVATVFRVDAFRSLRPQLLCFLSSSSIAGLPFFVAQVREVSIRTQAAIRQAPSARSRPTMALPYSPSPVFCGSWHFNGSLSRVTPLTRSANPVSMWTALQFVRELAAITIDADGGDCQVVIRADRHAVDKRCGMEMLLDCRPHVFRCFPSGLSTMAPLHGRIYGDYRAKLASPTCLVLELYSWPCDAKGDSTRGVAGMGAVPAETQPPNQHGERVKLRVSIRQRRADTILLVDGIVEHAPVMIMSEDDADVMVTGSLTQRLAVTGDNWIPTVQIKALYLRSP